MEDRYKIGGEYKMAVVFAVIYFLLGLLFGEFKISFIIAVFFIAAIALERYGFEAPLAIFVRTVHIIFFGMIMLSAMKII
jgi:hypothetical protein